MSTTHTRPRALQAAASTGLDFEMTVTGEVGWDVTAAQFLADLRGAQGGPVTVFVDSRGGDVLEGVGVYQALKDHPGRVTVRVGALAASAASVIAMAGDDVVMASSSLLMIHDAWSLSVGDATDHRKAADLLDLVSDNIAGVYAARAGGTAAEWRKTMKGEAWFSASEAVAAGLADRVSDGQALNASVRQATVQAAVSAPTTAGPMAAVVREGLRAGLGQAGGVPLMSAGARRARPVGRRAAPDMMPLIKTLAVARRSR